jgi:hypothetical protein
MGKNPTASLRADLASPLSFGDLEIVQDGPTRLIAVKETDTPGLQASEHTMQKAVRDVTTGNVRFWAAISGWPPNQSLGHTDDEALVVERRRQLRSRRRARN